MSVQCPTQFPLDEHHHKAPTTAGSGLKVPSQHPHKALRSIHIVNAKHIPKKYSIDYLSTNTNSTHYPSVSLSETSGLRFKIYPLDIFSTDSIFRDILTERGPTEIGSPMRMK